MQKKISATSKVSILLLTSTFLMRNSAISMDQDFDPIELEEAVRKSLNTAFNEPYGYSSEGEEDEEELLRQAKALSLQELASEVSCAANKQPEDILYRLIKKGQSSAVEADYLKNLNPLTPASNFGGYIAYLDRQDRRTLQELMQTVDKAAWAEVYRKLKLGKRTASHVFILLDEAKDLIKELKIHPFKDSISKIDHVLLELLSGKWGFSKKHWARDIMEKLNKGARGIGRSIAETDLPPKSFSFKVFEYFEKRNLTSSVPDSDYRRHWLAAFSHLVNGYLSAFAPDFKASKLEAIVEESQSRFKPQDFKGFLKNAALSKGEALSKVIKNFQITPKQQAIFDSFISPLKGVALQEELIQFKEFLETFNIDSLTIESQARSLELFQLALQAKPSTERKRILEDLIKNDLLAKEIRSVESILFEAVCFNANLSTEKIYADSIKQATEKAGSLKRNTKTFNEGLQIWLRAYFAALHQKGYENKKAYIVSYEGQIQGQLVERDDEVTEQQFVIADEHMAAYAATNDLKAVLFPGIEPGYKTVLSLTNTGVKIDLINEDTRQVIRTERVVPAFNIALRNQIGLIKRVVEEYQIDPNVLPATVEKKEIPTDKPLSPYYAVKGGFGMSEAKRIQSRGRAIDVLIRESIINRSLKLPLLLFLYDG